MARMLIIQDMALEYFGVEMISAVAKEVTPTDWRQACTG